MVKHMLIVVEQALKAWRNTLETFNRILEAGDGILRRGVRNLNGLAVECSHL